MDIQFRFLPAAALLAATLSLSATAHAAQPDPAFTLDLGGRTFDPLIDARASTQSRNTDAGLRLVQFDGPTRPEWLEGLMRQGATPLQYIHPYSYVVWADAGAMSRTAQLAGVRWQGDFLPEYAGNLDIMTAAALRTAEMFAEEAAQGRLNLPAR